MKRNLVIVVAFLVVGCGEDPGGNTTSTVGAEQIDMDVQPNTPIPDDEPDTPAIDMEVEVESSAPIIEVGFSNSLPLCSEAASRIATGVEPGMTMEQILSVVGKPRKVGIWWEYGSGRIFSSGPIISFDYSSDRVVSYSINASYCDDSENSFIEGVNGLIAQQDETDYTDQFPTCLDAATRIAAKVTLGMNKFDVRRKVGKPISLSTFKWEYGIGVNVHFSRDASSDDPYVVSGYSTACQ